MQKIIDKLQKFDTVTLKLISGEELVANFMSIDDDAILIDKPLALNPTPQGVGLVPWIFSSKPGETYINRSSILSLVQTDGEVAEAYQQNTSSIVRATVAPKKILTE